VNTNGLGGFVFTKLSTDDNYLIEVLQSDIDLSNAKIILTNKSGKQIKVINANANGKFAFNILSTEKTALQELKVDDKDLLMNLKGKLLDPSKNNLSGKTVMVMDDKGNIIASVTTDDKGNFEFKNLAAGKNYLIGIEEKDGNLAGFEKLYIADAKGKIIREIFRDRIRGFKFHLLETEKSALAELFVDDPWLEVLNFKNAPQEKKELTIVEKVSYGLNEFKFDKNGQLVLDKVIQIMKDNPGINIELGSHTDSRSDDNFNQKLSQKRAKFAVDYIISKGIDKSRLIAVGHGESKLLNQCGNGINCPEELHAVNRRTEFKVIDTGKK
jgi:outer membrane protein OmpA-like peptidoglycan-associated protein